MPLPAPPNPRQNHLLNALPAAEWERIEPQLELVPMTLGEVLYESGISLRHVYFPTDSIVSLLYVMEMARPPKSPWSATKAWSASPVHGR
jgi:hypothetical protein